MDFKGQCIDGRYLIGAMLGEGTDALVHYAMDRHLRRTVAIKLLRPELCLDPTFVMRFEREARSAGRLNHPNIVPIYDYGEALGTYYLVMDYVRGGDLRAYLEPGQPLAVETAVRVAAEVAEALGAAHARGLVHRDVKPANILLTEDGQAMVTDFGIAKMLDVPALTPASVLLGTPHYLAPEQAGGGAITPATDVYALGVLLYEMLAGRRPFVGESLLQVAMLHLHGTPPPLAHANPAVPSSLAALVGRMLAKNPAARFADGAAAAEALRALEPAGATVEAARSYRVPVWSPDDASPAGWGRPWSPPSLAVATPAGDDAPAGDGAIAGPAAGGGPATWGQRAADPEPTGGVPSAARIQPAVVPLAPSGTVLSRSTWSGPGADWPDRPLTPAAAVRRRNARLSATGDHYTTFAVLAVCLGLLAGALLTGRMLLGDHRAALATSVDAAPASASAPVEPAPAPPASVREHPIVTLDPVPIEQPAAPAQPDPLPVAADPPLPRAPDAVPAQPAPSAPAAPAQRGPAVEPAARVEAPSPPAARARVDDRHTSLVADEVALADSAPTVEPEASAPAPPQPQAAPAGPSVGPPRRGYGQAPVQPPMPLPPIGMLPPYPMVWGPPPGPLPPRLGPPVAMPPFVLIPAPPAPAASQQAVAANPHASQRRQ